MGLLDNIGGLLGTSMEDPRTMATLQMAQGLLGGGGSMQRLAGGLQGYGGVMAQARQAEEEKKRRALQEQMLMQQLEAAKAQQAERAAAAAKQKAVEDSYRQSILSPAQQALAGGGGPTMGNAAAMQGMAPKVDQQALIRNLMQADPMMAAQMLQPKPRKIARTVDVEGPNGEKLVQQFDEEGNAVGQPVPGYTAPTGVNLGNRYEFLKPRAGVSAAMGNSPDALLSASTTRRGQDMTDARSREANARVGGNARTGPMSVTLQKELLESDDTVQSAGGVVRALTSALKQNDSAYSGYLAKPRAVLRSNLPGQSQSADATIDIDNLMTGQGLESLKSIFGAAPTEGERKILMDMQASVDKTPGQRKAIMERAVAAAERRAAYAARKAQAIRDGSYLTEGIPPLEDASPGKGSSLNDLLNKYGN